MLDRYIGLAGLILGLVAFVAPYRWHNLPRGLTSAGLAFAVLLIGFALGMFYAGQAARGRSVEARRLPALHFTVPGANVFIPDKNPEWTGVALDATVWNTGAPSIATEWAMKVVPNGRPPVVAQLTQMPNVLTATGPFNSAKLRAENSLVAKTMATQVGMTPVSGVLLFYVPLPKAVVQAPDTVWEITVKDAFERETKVTQLVGDWLQR